MNNFYKKKNMKQLLFVCALLFGTLIYSQTDPPPRVLTWSVGEPTITCGASPSEDQQICYPIMVQIDAGDAAKLDTSTISLYYDPNYLTYSSNTTGITPFEGEYGIGTFMGFSTSAGGAWDLSYSAPANDADKLDLSSTQPIEVFKLCFTVTANGKINGRNNGVLCTPIVFNLDHSTGSGVGKDRSYFAAPMDGAYKIGTNAAAADDIAIHYGFTEDTSFVGPLAQTGDIVGTTNSENCLSYPCFTIETWTGAIDSEWTNPGNWGRNVVPSLTNSSIIPINPTNNPIIGTTTGVSIYDLTVDAGASLTLESGSSLMLTGTPSGEITYQVATIAPPPLSIAPERWHLVSSPVVGETYDYDSDGLGWITDNNVAFSPNNDRAGIAPFDSALAHPHWDHFAVGEGTKDFEQGIGYAMLRQTAGNYRFTGAFSSGIINKTLVFDEPDNNGWNLMGNPYTSYIDIAELISTNINSLLSEYVAIYVWNGDIDVDDYEPLTTGYLHPGQGFFVHTPSPGAWPNILSINEDMQSHQADAPFYKTSNPSMNLLLSDGTKSKDTEINFLEGKMKGLDPGFDIGLFNGNKSSFTVFSHLVENNKGIAFEKQALPNSDFESLVIPIGVKAAAGKEITLSLTTSNLSSDIKVYLEDAEMNTYTRLDEENSEYTVTLTETLTGVGRFFLRTSFTILDARNEDLLAVSIYNANQKIYFSGLPNGNTKITVYDLLGKEILKSNTSENATSISSKSLINGGVYLVNLRTEKGSMNKKLVIQ